MIGPSSAFASLGIEERIILSREQAMWLPNAATIARETAAALARHELEKQDASLIGAQLVLPQPDGHRKYLRRTPLYSVVRMDEVLPGVRAHIATIAERHGPGRVWFLAAPVHIIDEDGGTVAAIVSGESEAGVVLRTFYGHETQAASW